MTTKINIFNEEWCNLVFEGKNKDYGAFELRQNSTKRNATAILLSVSLFAFGISAPSLLKKVIPEQKWNVTEVNTIANINDYHEEVKPPIDLPQPQLRRTIAFAVPIVANDDEINQEPPIIDNLLASNAAISTRTQDGLDDPTAPVELEKPLTEETPEPVHFVPQMPEFMGGEDARIKFLHDNLKYPSVAAEMGITGKVTLQFVVEKDGTISKITVLRGIGGGCDEEAVRVAKLMPRWKPGRQNGRAVPVYFIMPIGFSLQNQ